MKASELRIGNYVNYLVIDNVDDRKEWYESGQIDWQDLKYLSERDERHSKLPPPEKGIEHYQPILLTEEWLQKMGFWFDSDSKTFKIYNCTLQLDNYDNEGFLCVVFGDDLRLIHSVHQLQNLYFALTGEELTIHKQT